MNNDPSVYETALSDAKTDEQTAHRDLTQAANDLHQIVKILKSGTGVHPAGTPTASS